ncbi:MAG: MASE1 domain-containing protein [Candidatus Omnitrophica bacterium]|nr:MASE1 domain-containing protein [Candidatus Omnitrophota bacterium]
MNVMLAAVYFAAGKFGLTLASLHPSATAIWPPTGIALAAFLLYGYRVWPGIFLGAFLVNITTEGSLLTCLGIASGNTLEGVVGAWLVNRFAHGRLAFERAQDIVKFAALAGLVSTTVSATLGVTSLALSGYANWLTYRSVWVTWWLGDMAGALIVAPLVLVWTSPPRITWTLRQMMEAVLTLSLLGLVGMMVFGGKLESSRAHYPMEFLCILPLVWSAFRFGRQRVTALAIAMLSVIAIGGTMREFGPFVVATQNTSLLLLQAFISANAISMFILTAVVAEHRGTEDALRRARDELEGHVQQRTAALSTTVETLKTTQLQLIHCAKLESVGRLAAGVAHEVKNPLAIILTGVEVLGKQLHGTNGRVAMVLNDMQGAVKRADAVIRGLLDFSAMRELELQDHAVNELIEEALLLVKHELDKAHVTVRKDLASHLPLLTLDRQKITQVLINLFLNAIHAMPHGGTLTVRTCHTTQLTNAEEANPRKSGQAVVEVDIEDTGEGIPEEAESKIFDPFFTTKPTGQGTGLGLTVARRIIELHEGTIAIANRAAGGVAATVRFQV